MSITAKRGAQSDVAVSEQGERIRGRDPLYMDILDFLNDEAALLDGNRLQDWLGLMSREISYFMPVRSTRMRKDGPGFSEEYGHFDENYASLLMRVKKNATPSSWGEDPPSRVRRFVTNVRAFRTGRDGHFEVLSDLLLTRNRLSSTHIDILTAERRDVIAQDAEQFKIVSRLILIDQATLGTANLAIFL